MSLISISEASELTGKSVPAIFRYIKEGKLSQADNKIDTTELIRVFGAFKSSTDYHRENDLLHRSNADLKQDKEKLYQINELLRHSIADLKQDKEKLYRIIASQQKWLSTDTMNIKANNQVMDVQIEATEVEKSEKVLIDQSLMQRLIRKLFFK